MNINAGVNERINTCLVPFLYEKRSFKLPRQAQDKHLQGGLLLRNRGGGGLVLAGRARWTTRATYGCRTFLTRSSHLSRLVRKTGIFFEFSLCLS